MLIGEVAEATGVSTKALRYYEQQGLLHPPDRTSGGYRDYEPDVLKRVGFIKQAQTAGLTLRQIGEILAISDDGRSPCQHVGDLVDQRLEDIERRIAELGRARTELKEVRRRLDGLQPADCDPSQICSAIA